MRKHTWLKLEKGRGETVGQETNWTKAAGPELISSIMFPGRPNRNTSNLIYWVMNPTPPPPPPDQAE